MSSGQFDPQFDVYGPVTLPENRAYYGRNDVYGSDALAHFMAIHAAEILDPEVDFSQYDTDGDGYIDNVFIFYAGEGENATGVSDTVWPHSWSLSDATDTIYKYDGVRLDSYACSNEWDNGTPDGIGTFVHEFSHVLGLPDLYDTYYTFSGTPGDWSVLDSGCYLNNSRTPCGYSAYECNALQWITPKELTGRASVELQPFRDSGDACIVNTSNEKEFFLFENRQKTGWDAYLPYHGMLIWHIDFDQTVFDNNLVNNTKNHQYVDIVEANNNTTGTETAERGYSWPGTTNKTTYTSTTTPAFKDWNGIAIDLPITDIAENGGVITFDVKGGMFDLTAPANIEVSDVTSSSFAIRWDKVNRATSYVLNIYTKDASGNKIYVDGYESLDLGDVDQYKVGYLQANTDYYLSIRSTADELESPLSDELVVSTTAFVFKEASVQTLKAENVGTDGFDAKWEALRDAVSYNLTVKAIDENLTTEQYLDFGEGTSLTIPEGWAFGGSESSTYVTAANFGKASPSLKFNKDGLSLTSPDFGKQIESVSFWCRGVNVLDTGSNLDVDVFVGDTWQTVSRVVLGDSTTVTLSDIPTGAQMLRFVFNKASGNAALDDVHVYLVEQSIGKLDGYDNLSVGNVTSYRVGDLPKDITKYSYTVTAKNASGEESLVSRSVKVDLAAGNSGVSDVKTASIGKVEYYNLQGLPVNAANLTPGLYIRRQGSSVQKVIVK
jgi:M6 family metalloprotease-like protein